MFGGVEFANFSAARAGDIEGKTAMTPIAAIRAMRLTAFRLIIFTSDILAEGTKRPLTLNRLMVNEKIGNFERALCGVFFLFFLDRPVDVFRLERQIVDSGSQPIGNCIAN